MTLAWHFVSDTLRDGSPVPPDGEKLVYGGKIELCIAGFHASKQIMDALGYAPGNTICRVKIGGEIIHGHGKLVASERTIIGRVDGDDILREFSRKCALDVIHLWDAPEMVVQFLETGDESLKDAAWDAGARAAARNAAWNAARDAAWNAAWPSARNAAWNAARNAAWAAGWDARDARDAVVQKQNRRLTRMVNQAIKAETGEG